MNRTLSAFEKLFKAATLKHILLNYSESETGLRHPKGPVGIINRDQGQVDIYAGRTKSILSVNGQFVNIAKQFGVFAETILFVPKSIKNLKIGNKHFNKAIYEGVQVVTQKLPSGLAELWVIGPETSVDPNTGIILNPVPLGEVLELKELFEEDPVQALLPNADAQLHNHWKTTLGF
jgi:hypothetical protein